MLHDFTEKHHEDDDDDTCEVRRETRVKRGEAPSFPDGFYSAPRDDL